MMLRPSTACVGHQRMIMLLNRLGLGQTGTKLMATLHACHPYRNDRTWQARRVLLDNRTRTGYKTVHGHHVRRRRCEGMLYSKYR
jgi:hypothetical protein